MNPEVQPNVLPHADSQSWLYGKETQYCDYRLDYGNTTTVDEPPARIFMSAFYAVCFGLVLLMPTRREETEPTLPHDGDGSAEKGTRLFGRGAPPHGSADSDDPHHRLRNTHPRSSGRWLMLDVARIACVFCVISEHSGGTIYSEHNTGFCTQWVLQWLFVVSGVAFMMSRSAFGAYFLRYGLVFAFGVACNVLGDVIARPNWSRDLGNTVFQMFYVVFITAISFCAWPLRNVLRAESDPFGGGYTACGLSDRLAVLLLYGGAFAVSWAGYMAGIDFVPLVKDLDEGAAWSTYMVDVIRSFWYIFSHTFGFGALVALHVFLRKQPDGKLTWLLLLYVYVPVIAFPSKMAYGPQMVMLYLLGFVSQAYPFAGAEQFKQVVRSYGLLFFSCMLLLSMPTLNGRCDIFPALTVWERTRFYANEAFLVLVLLTRTLEADDPLQLVRPLSYWALFAFCSHVMLARTLPVPVGATISYGLLPVFVVVYKLLGRFLPSFADGSPADGGAGSSSTQGAAEPMLSKDDSRPAYGTISH